MIYGVQGQSPGGLGLDEMVLSEIRGSTPPRGSVSHTDCSQGQAHNVSDLIRLQVINCVCWYNRSAFGT